MPTFPTMTDDELSGLAAGIKENGLIHPIVTDVAGVVIGGRNRLQTCELAGIEPRFEKTEGDPAAFIVPMNLNWRNLSKGQQAIELAMIYQEEKSKGERGKKDAAINSAETAGFSATRAKQAREVLRHSRALAEAALAGTIKLNAALRKMEEDRNAASSAAAK